MTDVSPLIASTYRVPRSRLDDFYDLNTPLPSIKIGAGEVISVEAETCTVMMGDEQVGGVVFLGDTPQIGDWVEVESRDDLLVTGDVVDLDEFMEGFSDGMHIVSDTEPITGGEVEINIAGSMRDSAAWVFLPPDDATWTRTLTEAGVGLEITWDET